MSSGGGGWPPGGAGTPGQGGSYADDDFTADRGYPGADGQYYRDQAGYEWSEPSERPRSHGDQYGHDPGDDYGQDAGRRSGRHSALSPYTGDGTAAGQRYDTAGYGRGYDWDSRGQAPAPYGQDSYGEDWRYRGGYGGDQRGRAADGYDADVYGGGRPGQDEYPRYGGDYYGQSPGGPGPDPYARAPYPLQGYPGADHEAGSSYRSDAGSYDGREGDWFSRRDTGSFGPADAYQGGGTQESFGLPSGSYRRAELGAPAARGGGEDQWHEPADEADGWPGGEPVEHDDWQSERAGGLLSRRFGDGSDDNQRRRGGRARRPKRLRGKFAFTAAILAGALVLGAIADYGYEAFHRWETNRYGDYQGAGTGRVQFTVPPGAALSSLGPALLGDGVIRALRPYDSAAAAAANASHLQPGTYLLHRHMNSALAVQWLLSSAHRTNDRITLIEGLRATQTAARLAKQTGLPASQFTRIIEHPPASLGLPKWAAGHSAEGFLFPDTYTLLPKMTALQVLQMMVTEFNHKIAGVNLVGAARNVFTSPWHALIVASLIQAEGGSVEDFGKISRVVWNRLRLSMPLQFDSTIFYALGKYGTFATQAEEGFKSPYNTYLHTGLPPGPIDSPGIAAIQAAVHAAHGGELYFITDTRHKPYRTYFTSSLTQFDQWKQQFQG